MPSVGVVLGSGLGQFGETIDDAVSISYSDIPHFNSTAVAGHKGRLIIGKIGNTNCAIFKEECIHMKDMTLMKWSIQ